MSEQASKQTNERAQWSAPANWAVRSKRVDERTVVWNCKKSTSLIHMKTFFSWVSKWAQRSALPKQAVQSKRMSERCEWTIVWRSEWPSRLCLYEGVFWIKPSHWDSLETIKMKQILFFFYSISFIFNFFYKNWFPLKAMVKINAAFFNGLKRQKKWNVAFMPYHRNYLFLSISKTAKKLRESCIQNSVNAEMNFNDCIMLWRMTAPLLKKREMDEIWTTKYGSGHEIPLLTTPMWHDNWNNFCT